VAKKVSHKEEVLIEQNRDFPSLSYFLSSNIKRATKPQNMPSLVPKVS